ncbi:hypothetical protein A3A09_03565 [Candidatus Nomurabacteria bacterium RIFCSPLOWO2_01_FULL_42_20]|uniref:Uncharacterized protein n=1 Tax=Candidatus Nomurabacteria bacterium RIFCSPHIGHO2_01_FULL_42_16 TaxID=1801743 RepID=A0A1F6VKR1_9BACT|nr:MAG: hypothetical protein A2824_01750 [Candidatus Nomurabacteria bacterium RIFCSPHIGHO2_01_FULL_42_16]OGI92059.1 MAG: hypothetical protein A3A09_03565 [Candidatus Nomurabacteria bacterium RIFCSPLOWO2_01_FULL_42_20]
MTTITIPKKLIFNDDLIILPRRRYEELLKQSSTKTKYDREKLTWKKSAKKNLFKLYSKADSIYDQI